MKSLDDLKKLRDDMQKEMNLRTSNEFDYRIVVGMATCGIAAGARPVLQALVEEVSNLNANAMVAQTGCIGMCSLEPMVEIYDKEGNRTTYVQMDAEKAKEVVREHIIKNNIIKAYTIEERS